MANIEAATRGAQYKADIDGPNAFKNRLITEQLEKAERAIRGTRVKYPTSAKAIKLQDDRAGKAVKLGQKTKAGFTKTYDNYGSRTRSRQSHGY